MAITKKELNPHNYTLTEEQKPNFERLFEIMNEIRKAYGNPMVITSGLRNDQDQARIDGAAGRIPRKSMHLLGAACDVWDRDGLLWKWCMNNMKLLEKLDIYLEDKSFTPTWVHFQILPPKSKKRIFIPYTKK